MNATNKEFTMTRIFDAPLDAVWKAWTEESQLQSWFGPKGCPIKSAKMDLKIGGGFHYCMGTPVDIDMWGKWVYKAIDPMARLVWQHTFSDAGGENITRHPFLPTWPLEMELTIVMGDRGDNKTQLTLSMIAVTANDSERDTWNNGMDGLNQGWGGAFDLLEEHLTRSK